MNFKKDYINYLLHTVVNSPNSEFRENYRLNKLVDSIIAVDDVMKVTYLIGRTAGLELLFKYLLYISDKIDKSQVTIFNLKDNFEYDKINITKICSKIQLYKSENVQESIKNITGEETESIKEENISDAEKPDTIKIETDEDSSISKIVELEDAVPEEPEEENDSGLTLIENPETYSGEAEVFELESISQSVENPETDEEKVFIKEPEENEETDKSVEISGNEELQSGEEKAEIDEAAEIETEKPVTAEEIPEDEIIIDDELPELEIEVHKPLGASQENGHVKEEAITSEAYIKFETRFFEEVKILEKLLATVTKNCITDDNGKLSEKCLQCMTEILGITSELSSLSRQLSFDLIADVFLTMNIYFTRSISSPQLLNDDRIKLFDSSLALVNSLIKGEDYLNYDSIVERIELLKAELSGEDEKEYTEVINKDQEEIESEATEHYETGTELITEDKAEENETLTDADTEEAEPVILKQKPEITDYLPSSQKQELKKSQMESAVFRLKYLIKEFEKSFTGISNLKGEYSRFEALERISELNNALRLIAKIAAVIKNNDVLKLAEVTYVFLKYVKDYRMDMQEPEVQQIIKYIIFTFKMLLTNRKPEDFNVLVQHLNNPDKIFADY